MPLRAGQIGGSRRLAGFAIPSNPGNLQSIRFNFTTNQWEFVTVTGELNTMTNVGAGPGFIFRNKIGVNFNIKSLINGTNMTILNNVDDITISTLAEINLAANVGVGAALIFRDKTGVTLNLKSLIAGSGITLVNGADDITITAAGGVGDLEFLRDKELAGDLLLSRATVGTTGVGASIVPAAGKTFFHVKSTLMNTVITQTITIAELRNNGTVIDNIGSQVNNASGLSNPGDTKVGVADSLVGDGAVAYDVNVIVNGNNQIVATAMEGWIQNT